jgi:hypothetical protein
MMSRRGRNGLRLNIRNLEGKGKVRNDEGIAIGISH